MAESVLRKKSYSFALKVIKVYKQIVAEKKEYVLRRFVNYWFKVS